MSSILGGKDPISLFLLQVIHCGALVFNRLPLVIFLGSHQPFEVDSTGMQGCQNTAEVFIIKDLHPLSVYPIFR
jgi:hypothetical protein